MCCPCQTRQNTFIAGRVGKLEGNTLGCALSCHNKKVLVLIPKGVYNLARQMEHFLDCPYLSCVYLVKQPKETVCKANKQSCRASGWIVYPQPWGGPIRFVTASFPSNWSSRLPIGVTLAARHQPLDNALCCAVFLPKPVMSKAKQPYFAEKCCFLLFCYQGMPSSL